MPDRFSWLSFLCSVLEALRAALLLGNSVHRGAWVDILFFTFKPFLLCIPIQGRLLSWTRDWVWMRPNSEVCGIGGISGINMARGISSSRDGGARG